MAEDQVFYVSQKAFIENEKGELLVLNDPLLGLDFPGGKIQIGEEDFQKAFKREVAEETGLEIEIGSPFHVWFCKNDNPRHRNFGKLILSIGYICASKKKTLKLSDEHDSYKWIKKEDIDSLYAADEPYKNAARVYFSLDD